MRSDVGAKRGWTPDNDTRKKASDPEVRYMSPDAGPFRCDNCKSYIQNNSPCKKVSSRIQSGGCCNLYEPREDRQQQSTPEESAAQKVFVSR